MIGSRTRSAPLLRISVVPRFSSRGRTTARDASALVNSMTLGIDSRVTQQPPQSIDARVAALRWDRLLLDPENFARSATSRQVLLVLRHSGGANALTSVTTDRQRIDNAARHSPLHTRRGQHEMTSRTRRVTLLVAAGALLTACSTTPPEAIPPPASVSDEALAAYERYWSVATSAYASPNSRDWVPEIRSVASGDAFEGLVEEVRLYAAAPAHVEGAISRSPAVTASEPTRAHIIDCIDLGDSLVINDLNQRPYEEDRVPRFTYRADVINQNGEWIVERVMPALDEPC